MLRVIQTYHGNGGADGYRFEVEFYASDLKRYVSLGELEDFPPDDPVVELDGVLYVITREYDVNDTKEDEEMEKMIIELEPFKKPEPSYPVLEWVDKYRFIR